MYELSVENSRGERLSFAGNNNYTVYKIDGLTPPNVTVNRSANSTMDGATINSTRMDSRNLVLYLTINGQVEDNRINLYKYFPPKGKVTIYYKNGARNVYIEGVVELIECDPFAKKQAAQISIICPKPYFKDIEYLTTNFSDISSLFSFPFSITKNGTEISTLTSNIRKKIINAGDVDAGIIIEVFALGTVVNPVIYDVLKRTKIKLNYTMKQSELLRINTNSGEKSIELVNNGITTNFIGYMSLDSSWLTLAAGDNVFTYTADEGSANLQISFTTSVLYSGV